MLYLSYWNTKHTDGFGSQLQRIISIYAIAKYFHLDYIHSGFSAIDYQGLQSLEANQSDPSFAEKANLLFFLQSTALPREFDEVFYEDYLTDENFEQYLQLSESKDILLQIAHAHTFVDNKPHILQILKTCNIYPWIDTQVKEPLQIAVHIRRGELFLVESQRMHPNEYFFQCMNVIEILLKQMNIPHKFTIYTEVSTKITEVTANHPGMAWGISTPVLLSPEQNNLSIFSSFSNVSYKINTDPFETFQELVNSDILICSVSSFSYSAALLKKKGLVLMDKKKFCHGSLPSWIDTGRQEDIQKIIDFFTPFLQQSDKIFGRLNSAF